MRCSDSDFTDHADVVNPTYYFCPNTRVRSSNAATSGQLTAVLWHFCLRFTTPLLLLVFCPHDVAMKCSGTYTINQADVDNGEWRKTVEVESLSSSRGARDVVGREDFTQTLVGTAIMTIGEEALNCNASALLKLLVGCRGNQDGNIPELVR